MHRNSDSNKLDCLQLMSAKHVRCSYTNQAALSRAGRGVTCQAYQGKKEIQGESAKRAHCMNLLLCRQASRQANRQASKPASRQASRQTSKQTRVLPIAPEDCSKQQTYCDSIEEPGPIVLWHAPVSCEVLGEDGLELDHKGLGIDCVKFEGLATLFGTAKLVQQLVVLPAQRQNLDVEQMIRSLQDQTTMDR